MQFLLELNDESERDFLLKLLAQFDFVKVSERPTDKEDQLQSDDAFFSAAGMLAEKEMDANQLRKDAWRIQD